MTDFPSRPLRLILPFQPGGAASSIGLIFATALRAELGQDILLENFPGNATAEGSAAVAGAPGDGHTLLLTNTALVIAQTLVQRLPYDTLRDLVGVSTLSRSERVLAIHPSVPASDLAELIAFARANPGRLNVCCHGTSNHLENVLFMQATDTEFTVAPYTGGGSADQYLLEGVRLQMVFNTVSRFAPYIKTGRLRGIAYTGERRHPSLPDVPTFAEAGVAFSAANWYMLLAPSSTPVSVLERINRSIASVQQQASVQEHLAREGVEVYPNSISATNILLQTQLRSFAKGLRDSIGGAE